MGFLTDLERVVLYSLLSRLEYDLKDRIKKQEQLINNDTNEERIIVFRNYLDDLFEQESVVGKVLSKLELF